MSSKVHHYRVRAKECCLEAARAEDNTRRLHRLEAAARSHSRFASTARS
jgi:hypothetical protein